MPVCSGPCKKQTKEQGARVGEQEWNDVLLCAPSGEKSQTFIDQSDSIDGIFVFCLCGCLLFLIPQFPGLVQCLVPSRLGPHMFVGPNRTPQYSLGGRQVRTKLKKKKTLSLKYPLHYRPNCPQHQ